MAGRRPQTYQDLKTLASWQLLLKMIELEDRARSLRHLIHHFDDIEGPDQITAAAGEAADHDDQLVPAVNEIYRAWPDIAKPGAGYW